ncbi:mitochondrial import receptor subunit TOM22 homolog, partial [Musca vetustissima]|uniref:mitochondrial import receptor subunit TOM22 homolog n=1 Tax=Musca vetustissima TaxID=27455 RepID=UPI002AB6A26F
FSGCLCDTIQTAKVDNVKIEDLVDSDPDIEFIEKDSGMSSLGGSKDETPERKTVATTNDPAVTEENYDDEPDETLGERIMGLAEMFPQPLRDFTGGLVNFTTSSIKGLYKFSCNASWIFFTSSVILFAPVIFETERAQMEEMQKTQQKQVLLGPGSAMSAVGEAPALPLIR